MKEEYFDKSYFVGEGESNPFLFSNEALEPTPKVIFRFAKVEGRLYMLEVDLMLCG